MSEPTCAGFSIIDELDREHDGFFVQLARSLTAAGRFAQALELTDPGPTGSIVAPLAIVRARSLLGLGRHGEAGSLIDRLARMGLAPAPLLEAGADARIQQGDWPGALDFLSRARALGDEARLRFRQAAALFNMDRFDESLTLMASVASEPDFALRAQTIIAKIHQRRREIGPLTAACEAILQLEPDNEFALEQMFRSALLNREFERSRKLYRKANRQNPTKFPPQMYEFLARERLGQYIKAIKPFRGPRSKDYLTDDFRENIGLIFHAVGETRQALRYARAIESVEQRELNLARITVAGPRWKSFKSVLSGRDGAVLQSIRMYIEGRPNRSIGIIDGLGEKSGDKLYINNFRDLVRSGARLSPLLYSTSEPRHPVSGGSPVIQQLWVGGPLTYIERLSIRSFLAWGHQVHLYSYDENLNVPAGCLLKDARDILPESAVFTHSAKTGRNAGSYAGFADLFRWKLIHERGGAWADSDLICLAPMPRSSTISTELVRVRDVIVPGITNCYFSAEAGEPAFRRAFERSLRMNRDELAWGEVGTHLMAEIVATEKWGDRLASPSFVCPIPVFRIIDAVAGEFEVADIISKTQCNGVHLYNEKLRDVGIDKNAPFPELGLVGHLERRVREREDLIAKES